MAKELSGTHLDAIYSSDLKRTYNTAKEISKARDMKITKDKELREIFGGEWEDVLWDELPTRFPESFGFWLKDPLLLEIPGGETMVEFQKRVCNAVLKIVEKNKGKTICIVTHGTAIKVMLCKYYGKSLSDLPDMLWHDNASITIVEFNDCLQPSVIVEGENTHLGGHSTLAKQTWWIKKE